MKANLTTTATTPTPSPQKMSSSDEDDWMKGVKEELSNMLDGIPLDEGGQGKNKGTLGSLWDFWKALDSMLLNG